jgi:hypothetical protein
MALEAIAGAQESSQARGSGDALIRLGHSLAKTGLFDTAGAPGFILRLPSAGRH